MMDEASIDGRMESWLEEQALAAGYAEHNEARVRYIETMRQTLAFRTTRLSLALRAMRATTSDSHVAAEARAIMEGWFSGAE